MKGYDSGSEIFAEIKTKGSNLKNQSLCPTLPYTPISFTMDT